MAWELTGNAGSDPATNFLGTTDNEPLIIKTNGVEDLRITPDGNVGIGTTGPLTTRLEIASDAISTDILRLRNTNAANPRSFRLGPGVGQVNIFGIYDDNAAVTRLAIDYSGNVGIGTLDTGSRLSIAANYDGDGIELIGSAAGIKDVGVKFSDEGGHAGALGFASAVNAWMMGVSPGDVVLYSRTGNVLLGSGPATATPTLTVSSNGLGVRGNLTVTDDVILTGADCAEEFDIVEAAEIEPGTVMIIDQDGALHQSQRAYDKRVAGVISGAGEYKPGLILDRQQSQGSRIPVALVGKVYCKVDAQYAAIEVGDLLTTSPTPGHAMKADDPYKAFGSVIGKALRSLEAGQEMIPILIALQ